MLQRGDNRRWIILGCTAVVVVLIVSLFWLRRVAPDDPGVESEHSTAEPSQQTVRPSGPDAQSTVPTSQPETPDLKQPPENVGLSCDYAAAYSGQFVEDGTDRSVKNVASILVTNQSDRFLEYGKLTYEIDGKTAVFEISALPSGHSAWVMEQNALNVTEDSQFVYVDAVTVYADDVVSKPKELTIQYGSNMLRVRNDSDRRLENVTVYYKVVHKDGNFFGGIAYRVNFGTLAPGEAIEKIAGHYKDDWTSIIRVTWQEAASDESS